MGDDLVALTERLAEVLEDETGLLDALELRAAVALLPRKRDAVAALQGALAAGATAPTIAVPSDPESGESEPEDDAQVDALREAIERVTRSAQANRVALERGLALQMQLIDTIAQAIPRGRAVEAPCYQPNGSQVPARPPEAYAFLSRM